MVGKGNIRRDKVAILDVVQSMCNRNQLALLAHYFHRLEKYTQRQRQLTHLKRCAGLLKHQRIRRVVTNYFVRWLSTTQRQTSIRGGHRELSKIVALPRNQDFINLSIRYLRRWRLWVRQLYHRKRTNIELLQLKINEGHRHRTLCHWMGLTFERRKNKFEQNVHELDKRNSVLNDRVAYLEAELDQKQKDISELRSLLKDIKSRSSLQSLEAEELRRILEAASDSLLSTSSVKDISDILQDGHSTEERAPHGDDKSLRLLTHCKAAARAFERVRKLLPGGAVHSACDFDTVAKAVCEHKEELDAQITRLNMDVHNAHALGMFLLNLVRDGAERIAYAAKHNGFSDPPLLSSTQDEKSLVMPLSDYTSYIEHIIEKSVYSDDAEIVRAHLSSGQALSEKAQSTADVFRSFYDAQIHLTETLLRGESLYAEQREAAGVEVSRRGALASAVSDAVRDLKHWKAPPPDPSSTLPREDSGGVAEGTFDVSVADEELIAQLRQESKSAAKTLGAVREVLVSSAVVLSHESSQTNDTLLDTHTETDMRNVDLLSLIGLPPIESHEDLPMAIRKLRGRLVEIDEAYENICNALRQYDTNLSRSVPPVSSAAEISPRRIHHAESVVQTVRKHIRGRAYEVQALRRAMRNGITALGGAGDESESDDDTPDADRSATKSFAMGEKLITLCNDTGSAIDDMKVALGVPFESRVPLSNVLPDLKERMKELEVVKAESAALVEDVRCALGPDALENSSLFGQRRLKPKKKPVTLTLQESCLSVSQSPQLVPHVLTSSLNHSGHPVRTEDIIRNLRREVKERGDEARGLHTACGTLLTLLDGSFSGAGGEEAPVRPPAGESLVPFLLAQAEEIKRAQQTIDKVFPEGHVMSRSVGSRMALLASTVESLRLSTEGLRAECEQRARHGLHIARDFTEECQQMRARGTRALSRAAEALQLCMENSHRRQRFALWRAQADAAARRREDTAVVALLDTALADLSVDHCERMEHDEEFGGTRRGANALSARAAAVAEAAVDAAAERSVLQRTEAERNALCSDLQRTEAERNAFYSDLQRTEAERNALCSDLQRIEAERNALCSDLQRTEAERNALCSDLQRTEAERNALCSDLQRIEAERNALCSDLQRIEAERNALCSDLQRTEAERNAFYSDLQRTEAERNALCSDLQRTEAERNALCSDLQRTEAERNALCSDLQRTEAERNALCSDLQRTEAERNALCSDLQRIEAERNALCSDLQRTEAERDAARAFVDAQDARIAQLQREHRDSCLAAALCSGAHSEGPRVGRADRVAAERAMIAEAKRLSLEAMGAVVSRDVAAAVGEVAERTVEIYRRTADAMDALCSGAGVGAEGLAELRSLSGARDEIVARLPRILRAPYVGTS